MKAREGNIALRFVTTTPEEVEELTSRLINYRVIIAILTKMRDDGKLSDSSFKHAVRLTGKNLHFSRTCIFSEVL